MALGAPTTRNDAEVPWLTVKEVAERLRMSTRIVYRLIQSGELHAFVYKPNERSFYRVEEAELERFIRDHTS